MELNNGRRSVEIISILNQAQRRVIDVDVASLWELYGKQLNSVDPQAESPN